MTVKNYKLKPGRKALAPLVQQGPQYVTATPPEMAAEEASDNAMFGAYSAERDLVNQILGQAQAFDALSQFSRTVRTSKLAHVKESKSYKALRGMKSRTSGILTGTWEEFCELLGRSADQVDEDIKNLRAFGEEALEALSRMGIGYRDLRQYRALPEDGRKALVEVATTGNKDELLDLAEDLMSRQETEKTKLAEERDKARGDYDQAQKKVEEKNRAIEALDDEVRTLKRQWKSAKPDERRAKLEQAISDTALMVKGALMSLSGTIRELAELAPDDETREFLGITMARLLVAVQVARDDDEMAVAIPILTITDADR